MDSLSGLGTTAAKVQKKDLTKGKALDAILQIEQSITPVSSKPSVGCPHACPACGMDGEQSKLALLMSHFPGTGTPDLNGFVEKFRNFGGSKAHAIVSQSYIRKQTRALLDDYATANKITSPCAFSDDGLWNDFRGRYMKKMLDGCTEPLVTGEEAEIVKTVTEKAKAAFPFRSDPSANEAKLRSWLEDWKKQQAKPVVPDTGALLQTPTIPTVPTSIPALLGPASPNSEQKKKWGLIRDKLFAWHPGLGLDDLVTRMEDTIGVLATSVPGATPGTFTEYVYKVDPSGAITDQVKSNFKDNVLVEKVDLAKVKETVYTNEFAGQVFGDLMSYPFIEGTQCRYCEDIQGDANMLQRRILADKHGLPPEYPGVLLAKQDPQAYMNKFMDKVADELRTRIKILCKADLDGDKVPGELKAQAQHWTAATASTSSTVTGPVQAFTEASATDLKDAVDEAVRTLPVSDKRPELSEGQIVGHVVKELQKKKMTVPKSLIGAIPGMLASHPELKPGARDKSYIPIRGTGGDKV